MNKALNKSLAILLIVSVTLSFSYSSWGRVSIVYASSTETFTTTTTWTAPTGVTSVTVEAWGGGGGGGGQNANTDGGGGGGGGAYAKKVVSVTPGNGYTVTVGAAGTGNTGCTASTAGGDSWFSTSGTVLAIGGSPGACSTGIPPAGGAGGAAASSMGDAVFSGGQGEKGRNSNAGLGGYGGSSAGTAADGWSGPQTWSTATYPTANTPTGAGHGGDGGASALAAGLVPASGNGGGGGGAAEGAPSDISGGNGAVGKIILTYNKPVNAPTQNGPANGATGVSITPTFTMTATDADTTVDNISYKVTIYSNSGCTTVVQTNDQAVSSTGWTGTDASCTASPTSCYASGTQGSYLTQSSLTSNTQYWWKASAKDPDGNGTFTDSSTCNSFTTIAVQPVLTQNDFEIFVDNDLLQPADEWPSGGLATGENGALTALPVAFDPLDPADEVRIRMNIAVSTAQLDAAGEGFILQYKETNDCTDGGSWTDVDVAAGAGTWRFAASTVADNTTLTATLISTSNVLGRYSKSDPTSTNPNAVPSGQNLEWDWHVEYNGDAAAHVYCFRMENDAGGALNAYNADSYPKIETRPGISNLMRHGEFFSTGTEKGFFWAD